MILFTIYYSCFLVTQWRLTCTATSRTPTGSIMSSSWSELLTGIFICFFFKYLCLSVCFCICIFSPIYTYICVATVMVFVFVQGAANAIRPAKEQESTGWSSSWSKTSKARICFLIFPIPSSPPPLATVAQSWWHAPGKKTCLIESSRTISWVILHQPVICLFLSVTKCLKSWFHILSRGGHAVETSIEFYHFSQVCWPHNCAMAEIRDARYQWAALYIVSDSDSNEKLSNDIWDIFSGPCREFTDQTKLEVSK